MSRLTTHVLDTASGKPGAGIPLELFRLENGSRHALKQATTNSDGRCDQPLLEGTAITPGEYELVFRVAGYFRQQGTPLADPPFLDVIALRFAIADPSQHYHVPLLVSPWSYSTYRGS
jgi:5-hydroxyisourate hydrolase